MSLTLFALAATIIGTTAIDTIGTYGCTSGTCVFSNPYLRFGTGSENSVNNWGLFVQPWYFSPISSTWYKLTFNNYPLDTAIGTGNGSTHWSGTTVVDLYSLGPANAVTDYSSFYVSGGDAAKTIGYGSIIANRSFVVNGQDMILQNTFSLGATDRFVKIVTRVINKSPNTLTNALIWTGTRDDYVGNTDSNTKTRGNLNTGSFVAVTSNSQSSRAIMITNPTEGVLFYSETDGVMTAYSMCCSFSNAYNTNPLALAPMTPTPTDGSYAAVLPIGTLAPEGSGAITWYYAAGAISSLAEVATSVAEAQAIDSGVQLVSTASSIASSTRFNTATAMVSSLASITASMSSSSSATATANPSLSPLFSFSSLATNTSTSTLTGTPTETPTLTQTPSSTSTFPLKIIIVRDVPQSINITEIFAPTVNSLDYMVFLSVFVPINILLLCVIVSGCLGVLYYLKKRAAKTKVIKIRDELFTPVVQSDLVLRAA